MVPEKIFMVGAGAAGSGLAHALEDVGAEVLGLWTRSRERAAAVRKHLSLPVFMGAWPEVVREADILVIAVPDAAIGPIALSLSSSGQIHGKHVVLHLSGSVPVEALGPLSGKVKGIGVCHPFFPFASMASPGALDGVGFGVAGDSEARRAAEVLASGLGGFVFPLPEKEKLASYHAAAAMASNFVTALLGLSERLLQEAGIDRKEARRALVPLARAALDNVSDLGPLRGLTGPFRRGDVETVRKHLAAVRNLGENAFRSYVALGLLTLDMARELNEAPSDRLNEIESLLKTAM